MEPIVVDCEVVLRPSKSLNLAKADKSPVGDELAEIIAENEEKVNAEASEYPPAS